MQTDPIGYEDNINLYAYVGNDPVGHVDPSGTGKVCVTGTGTRLRSCVSVDGNGDGETSDNDLTKGQKKQFANGYRDFILDNKGSDISGSGKNITGNASESDKTMARVTSQFVGYGISKLNIKKLNEGWSKLDSVYLGVDKKRGDPAWTNGISKIGLDPNSKWFRAGPSNIARMLFHETYHLGYGNAFGTSNFLYFFGQHSQLDNMAKDALKNSGLGGGGCLSNFPFSGC